MIGTDRADGPGGSAPGATLATPGGREVRLGEPLGRGGEALVYSVADDSTVAAKVYLRPDPERERKLRAMLARVPEDRDRRRGHVSLAWPTELLRSASGETAGFLMPRVDSARYLPLHQLYNPGSRRARAPGISWRYLVRTARNLCTALAALHDAGYVVGDLNESNILVDDRALVTLVDLDSIQVGTPTKIYRCPVGKLEYTPPELLGHSFRTTTRRVSSDRFGLAVLIFLLLMEGNHPFTGVFHGSGEPPGLEANLRARRSPYFRPGGLTPPPTAPPLESLAEPLQRMLRSALTARAWNRPDADSMGRALAALEGELRDCDRVPTHSYRGDLPECPWCLRTARLGRDPYPAPGPVDGRLPASRAAASPQAARASTEPAVPAASSTTTAGSTGPVRRAANPRAAVPTHTGSPANNPASVPSVAQRPRSGREQRARPSQATTHGEKAPGYRGPFSRFLLRLPALVLLTLSLSAIPAYLLRPRLLTLFARLVESSLGQGLLLAATALMPFLILAPALFVRARRNGPFARGLLLAERTLRSLLASGATALALDLAAGYLFERGTVLAGDLLLLPGLWLATFILYLRLLGPRRY